ncbi:MAG: prepilin-type N-terminal cleavage/methylation domain-containing protein [Candidatus Omnitrophica bacterium]|nr:prepilin-type N-terminal cleavage/methylation domain-containing protein [Candidatus Omnitrophota bacterium]
MGAWGERPSLHGFTSWRPALRSFVGFTLVEVLLSIAILSAGAVLVMQALARGAFALNAAEARTTVYTFAAAKLADLEIGFGQGLIPKTSGEFKADGQPIRWRLETSPVAEEPELELVTLAVSWPQGRQRQEERFTMVRRINPEEQP